MQNTASKNMYVFGEKIEDDEETGEEGARKKRRKFNSPRLLEIPLYSPLSNVFRSMSRSHINVRDSTP